MRTTLLTVLVFAGTLAFGPQFVTATTAPEPVRCFVDDGIAMGVIESVDFAKSVFKLELADGTKLDIMFNDDTEITVNGQKATKEALKEDAKAAVSHDKGVATKVAITSD